MDGLKWPFCVHESSQRDPDGRNQDCTDITQITSETPVNESKLYWYTNIVFAQQLQILADAIIN